MNLITVKDDLDNDYQLPSYNTPGKIIFEIYDIDQSAYSHRYLIEYAWDELDTSTFWINESIGLDYWINEHVNLDQCGWYVIEGITGSVYKDYWGEADEEWDFKLCRYATEQEIKFVKEKLNYVE
jgi:hypothetical protein